MDGQTGDHPQCETTSLLCHQSNINGVTSSLTVRTNIQFTPVKQLPYSGAAQPQDQREVVRRADPTCSSLVHLFE